MIAVVEEVKLRGETQLLEPPPEPRARSLCHQQLGCIVDASYTRHTTHDSESHLAPDHSFLSQKTKCIEAVFRIVSSNYQKRMC